MVDLVRLPVSVERGARGGPNFVTSVVTLGTGQEGRNQEWSIARHSWDISYGVTGPDDLETVRAFFYACAGRARSFLFKDWSDYKGTLETVAAVAGQPAKRQLVKTYTNGAVSYVRLITHPILETLHVYVDTLETEDYTFANGILTFTGGDPGSNVVATFEFDIPVRFDTDTLSLTMYNILSQEIPSIPVIEVIGE